MNYNKTGQIISEQYINYMENDAVSIVDTKDSYIYKDTLLVKIFSLDEDHDSTRTINTYNNKGSLTKSEYYDFKKRIKKGVDKGNGRPGGCIVTKDDYEKSRTWRLKSEINYEYDNNGNKIVYDASKKHWDSQNKYTWKYDSKNRITEHSSYNVSKKYKDQLYWTEKYEYFDGVYKYVRTSYDYDGNPKHLKEKSWEYSAQVTYEFKVNAKGQIIEQKVTDEKGKIYSKETTEYNAKGLIDKTIAYDGDDKPLMTHVYKYTY